MNRERLYPRVLSMMPDFFKRKLKRYREFRRLRATCRPECHTRNLRFYGDIELEELLAFPETESRWNAARIEIERFTIPDGTGGINPGDRRAVYYLVDRFQPASVLEIGTHIGASTLHIGTAMFLHQTQPGLDRKLVTVDIEDVNNPVSKPWLKFGAKHSPAEMMREMGFETCVEFVKSPSFDFMETCREKFDFIFLDGDHGSTTVYREIPLALNLLRANGLILLHDYFPDLRPLWPDAPVLCGPFLATECLKDDALDLTVLPLKRLPWPTKLQSNVTSLALLLRK